MRLMDIQTGPDQRELTEHGSLQFPLEIHYDSLYEFCNRRVACHWHEELEIPVVLQGAVRYRLRDQTVDLEQGEGLVINSRVPHSTVPLGEGEPVLLTTIFHPSLLYGTPATSVYQNLLGPYMRNAGLAGIRLSRQEADFLGRINALYQEAPFGFELEIQGLLCRLFFGLLSGRREQLQTSGVSQEASLSRLKALLDILHRNYGERLSLGDLAASVSLSREGCCRFFKSMTGKTISQYLEDYRVSQGILLLADESYSIAQIAYLVGFGNPGRFSAAFSRRMHCTPRQYRQRQKTKQE